MKLISTGVKCIQVGLKFNLSKKYILLCGKSQNQIL